MPDVRSHLANARYTGGLVTYLDVITAQEQVLSNERLAPRSRDSGWSLPSCWSKRSAAVGTARVSPRSA